MKTRYLYLIHFVMSILDIAVVNLSFYITCYYLKININSSMNLLIVANYLWILAAVILRLYKGKTANKSNYNYNQTFKSFVVFAGLFFSYILLAKDNHTTVYSVIFFFAIMLAGLFFNRYINSIIEKLLKRYFNISKPVAVIGMNSMGLRLAGFFQDQDNHYAFEGFLNQENTSYLDKSGNILPAILDQLKSAADNGIKEVYVSLSPERLLEYDYLQHEADKHCLRLKLVPDLSDSLSNRLKLSYMNDFTILSHRYEPLEEVENRFKKRVFDIIFSSLVIVFILSWLYPLIGLLIKLQSPGPVLFKQLRSGKDNKDFLCYKFRSMKMNNDDKQATKDDDRITKIGKFLRKTSLDEFPQFFNVFLGDMSIIGPRPHPLNLTKQYGQIINQYMVRHFLKSGITGWAQVSGFRGETKDPELMQKRVEHDIWYLENWSMWLDLKIIYMTIINVIKGEDNAY